MLPKPWLPQLHFNKKVVIATIVVTTLIMIDHYFKLTPIKELDRLILYLFIPIVVIILVFHDSPRDYGVQLGNWHFGLLITVGSMVVLTPAMQEYYAIPYDSDSLILSALELLGWEFVFRGFLLFSYFQVLGDDALWLQAVPFALAHLGKPPLETLSTLFGGFLFGLVALKTRSFIYPFLIHFFVSFLVTFFAIK
jgi:membrane protease YdiL (CAAX protease family)